MGIEILAWQRKLVIMGWGREAPPPMFSYVTSIAQGYCVKVRRYGFVTTLCSSRLVMYTPPVGIFSDKTSPPLSVLLSHIDT
jgi:hypothetical protein